MNHVFVEHIPEHLEAGVLYVSIEFDTAVHTCACGCGNEVVTPLSPAEWSFTYDGRAVSLSPSIGNWGFPCRSHYWIRRGKIEWASRWSDEKIKLVREKDRIDQERLYSGVEVKGEPSAPPVMSDKRMPATSFFRRLLRWLD